MTVFDAYSSQISTEALREALQQPTKKVRIFAAKTLAARSMMSAEEIAALKVDESAEIWQAFYLERIAAGVKFNPDEVRANLRHYLIGLGLGSLGKVDADKVVRELFQHLSYEELLSRVDFRSEDGPIAYRVLAESYFDKFSSKLRADIEDDFELLKSESKYPEPSPSRQYVFFPPDLFGSESSRKVGFLAAALSGMASHAEGSDREFLLRFVEHKSDQVRITAIRGLRRVGVSADTDRLLGVAESATGEVAMEAARVALALAPGEEGAAARLVKSSKSELLKLAITALLNCDAKKTWYLISERLYDDDEDIRKPVCAYAIIKFSPKRLEKILKLYLSRDRYFYNVVFYLDRVLYARLPLRKIFRREIEEFLK